MPLVLEIYDVCCTLMFLTAAFLEAKSRPREVEFKGFGYRVYGAVMIGCFVLCPIYFVFAKYNVNLPNLDLARSVKFLQLLFWVSSPILFLIAIIRFRHSDSIKN